MAEGEEPGRGASVVRALEPLRVARSARRYGRGAVVHGAIGGRVVRKQWEASVVEQGRMPIRAERSLDGVLRPCRIPGPAKPIAEDRRGRVLAHASTGG